MYNFLGMSSRKGRLYEMDEHTGRNIFFFPTGLGEYSLV